ncbi:MAG: LapA family protein [Pseudanabaena sp.]|jgi:uncharacterized integral membrane protein|uniref:LapA family protein n=1 Tax=Pseudanabaena mucicola TaxID=71190 RepID=UPI002577FCC6|nr:LapA family protein [Pseudanabaena mucicola]MCA6509854.1 LapA family protein [Pseudanabaena sp. M109S1SP2A07QC]MCA6574122.1 LapA family protein [Pseudanabaena sp. M53BS1SP1A06MG]MCA6583510.1 LapA family protein [Pseudanabaena sp. M34BS1SP1A06MG]MCA6591468.1 LapA family protein [Pseudanabaena sp. M38BS1SP1A06MG]MCA6595008.1 LapA family protein [Pseudanabaena sp. M046S1SP1A06QC]MCA6599253.1 LapA family protein [Pseudanabaena sp. M57BS1SP1A06MG]MCA6603572.1 LapA family protein [Pseudanabaena
MTRSPFASKSQTNNSKKNAGTLPIMPLLILGIGITLIAAVIIQNLQPVVQIFFLGQKTIPIPLSMAMLIAFMSGGFIAFVCNAIASWQQNMTIRRAIVAAGYDKETQKEQVKSTNSANNYPQDKAQSQDNQDLEDDEFYDEDEDDELEEDEDLYEEEEDEDPDTVPYGDRKNLKPAKLNREKRDRPPLEAKYIR